MRIGARIETLLLRLLGPADVARPRRESGTAAEPHRADGDASDR